jgi:rhodanese-related sulfurtransferase
MDQVFEFVGNHPALFGVLLLLIMLFIANEVHGTMTGGRRMSPSEAVRLINDRAPLIIDVRSAGDFKKGHLLGAQSVPLAKLDGELDRLAKDPAKPLLVYCALGNSSQTAAHKLMKGGLTEVYPLRGGINAWLGAGLPVTTK